MAKRRRNPDAVELNLYQPTLQRHTAIIATTVDDAVDQIRRACADEHLHGAILTTSDGTVVKDFNEFSKAEMLGMANSWKAQLATERGEVVGGVDWGKVKVTKKASAKKPAKKPAKAKKRISKSPRLEAKKPAKKKVAKKANRPITHEMDAKERKAVRAGKTNPVRKTKSPATKLIERCHRLWEAYTKKPTKKALKEVASHLDKMRAVAGERVKKEASACSKAVAKEARRLNMVVAR
jgi:hypothetical protein